jgi:hypothetical protein
MEHPFVLIRRLLWVRGSLCGYHARARIGESAKGPHINAYSVGGGDFICQHFIDLDLRAKSSDPVHHLFKRRTDEV